MATGIVFARLENSLDGAHAKAMVYGTPTGPIRFLMAETPEVDNQQAVPMTSVSAEEFTLLFPAIGLWYVWAEDNGGQTTPQAVWVGLSDDPDLDLCGMYLADTLKLHEPGLLAALRPFFHEGMTIKSTSYGSVQSVDEFPAILITKPRESAQPVFFPLMNEHTYRFEILIFVPHQERNAYLRVAAAFTTRIMQILNRAMHRDFVLPSGTAMGMCSASEGDADEVQEDEKTWTALGSVMWSGSAWKGERG